MLYNGVFGCHGNICYVILINAFLCKIHSIGPINVCTILRSIGTKLTNLDKLNVFFDGSMTLILPFNVTKCQMLSKLKGHI